MAGSSKRKRKTTLVLPESDVRGIVSRTDKPDPGRFHYERFADGSERPVRQASAEANHRDQAFSDFFGVRPVLSPKANIRTMDSLLAEVSRRLNLSEADFAPEILEGAWQEAVGPFLSSQSRLVSIARGTAAIRTAHPAVRYELQRLKPTIIGVLNNVLGEGSVLRVRIMHG